MQRYSSHRRPPLSGSGLGHAFTGSSGVPSVGMTPLPEVSASPTFGVPLSSSFGATDASDEEVNQLLKELECSVGSPHAAAVMRDAVWAIERRAVATFDPLSRDPFLEQRIRDVLSELSRTSNAKSLLLAVDFIDALLAVPYTNPQQKFTRLCRSLFIVLHCGIERPAKEAQRVLRRMLTMDLTFTPMEPPLKSFITKELKDICELAAIQLHGRAQQTKAPFVAQFLAVILALAATAEVNPRYLAGQLRPRAVQLATALAGSFDVVLRRAAYECLLAIFSHSNAMRSNEVVLENRRVLDDAIRSLNTSHNNESSIISTLQSLRALITSRGIHCMDKQILPQLCVLVTEQHRVSKSPAVRVAVCNLVPVIAETDIASTARRIAYCAIIMEPVKNVRDEKSKDLELRNVAAFIQSVGYDVLDATNRTNLDSILLRYITRRETQEECWHILAAICGSQVRSFSRRTSHSAGKSLRSNGTSFAATSRGEMIAGGEGTPNMSGLSTELGASPNVNANANRPSQQMTVQHVENLVRRCIPHISHALLSEELVQYTGMIQEYFPTVSSEIQVALDSLVDRKLKDEGCKTPKASGDGDAGGAGPQTGHTMGGSLGAPLNAQGTSSSSYMSMAATTAAAVVANIGDSTTGSAQNPTTSGMNRGVGRFAQYWSTGGGNTDASQNVGGGQRANTGSAISTATLQSGNNNTNNNNNTTNTAVAGPHNMHHVVNSNPNMLSTSHLTSNTAHSGAGGLNGGAHSGLSTPTQFSLHISHQQQQQQRQQQPQPVSAPELKVALGVFAKRQIVSVQQLEEVKTSIIHYQRHPDAQVRQQCSTSVVESLSRWTHYAKQHRTSTYSTRVTEILEMYLKHVVMELDPNVRLIEIKLLADATELRQFLSEQRILKTLMSFLHDTSHVREKTVELLVSLTQEPRSNPSVEAVQQSLLVVVESCIVALEYSTDQRLLTRHMSDLQTFAKFSLKPLTSHLHRILIAFHRHFTEETLSDVIALSILKTLHAILSAFGKDEEVMLQYQEDVAELYVPVVDILRWSTSPSLSHAAIGVLVKMHAMGASPREWDSAQQHDLLHFISSVYIGASSSITEDELDQALTLFGQLGAVDPSTRPDTAAMKKKDDEAAIQDEADLELTYDYTVIVYRDLSRMLDVSLSETVCVQAMRTLLHLVQTTTDKKELIGGAHAVKAVLQIAKRANDVPSLRIEALHVLAALTALRHEKISKTLLPEIVVLLEQLWYTHDHALFRAVLEVVSALKPGNLSTKEQSELWPWIYPRLVDVALQDRTESREFCLRVMGIILNASFIPPHAIPIVFPMLMQFLQQSDQLVEVRSLSLCVSIHIVCDLKAIQHLSSLLHAIHTLARHCELSEDLGPRLSTALVRDSLKVLAALHPSGKATIRSIHEHLRDPDEASTPGPTASSVSANDVSAMAADSASAAAMAAAVAAAAATPSYLRRFQSPTGRNAIPSQRGTTGSGGGQYLGHRHHHHHHHDEDDDDARPLHETYVQGQQDITLFMRHVEFGLRSRDTKWREWFSEFQKNIIVVSPHPAFRIIVDLFDKHEPLRRKLFHSSFKCFYESLNAEHMRKVNEVLNLVLRSSDSELVSKCLGLADYLDHNPPNIKEPVLIQLRQMESNDGGNRTTLRFSSVPISSQSEYVSTNPTEEYSRQQQQQQQQQHGGPAAAAGAGATTTSSTALPRVVGMTNVTATTMTTTTAAAATVSNENYNFESPSLSLASPHEDITNANHLNSNNKTNNNKPNTASDAPLDSDDKDAATNTTATIVPTDDELGEDFGPLARPIRSASAAAASAAAASVAATVSVSRAPPIPNNVNPLFSIESLVEAAQRTRMYDKVMSYLENKLLVVMDRYRYTRLPKDVVQSVVFPLAWLYSKREMQDSVVGLFRAIRYQRSNEDGFGYELMQWWDVAQSVYEKKVKEQKSTTVDLEGYVRTLCLCGEWEKALEVVKAASARLQKPSLTVAESGAMAAWILGDWEQVKQFAERIPVVNEKSNTALKLFYMNAAYLHEAFHLIEGTNSSNNNTNNINHNVGRAVASAGAVATATSTSTTASTTTAAVGGGGMATTSNFAGTGAVTSVSTASLLSLVSQHSEFLRGSIHRSKMCVDESLKTHLPLSYAHAYENLTMLQHFNEMEEQIAYVESRSATFRDQLVERWKRRFLALKPDSLMPSLHSLMLHSLVLDTGTMSEMILSFCERMGPNYPQLSTWAMAWLQQGRFPRGSKQYLRNRRTSAQMVSAQPNVTVVYISQVWSEGRRTEAIDMMEKFLTEMHPALEERHPQCYGNAQLRLGAWKQDVYADSSWKASRRQELLHHFHAAIRAVPSSYEAWQSWGLMNYRVQQRDHNLTAEEQYRFVEAAHQGFVAAICRCSSPPTALPAVMRLLQLWVIHNGVSLLKESVADSVSRIPTDYWVQAIPQLIGHLSSGSHDVREVVSMILRQLCEVHSQAVVFPLLVVFMSDDSQPRRRELAQSIAKHLPKRIRADADRVARLLVDVSAIPIEKIRENLSAVSTAWNPNAEYEEDPEEVRRRLKAVLDIFSANRRHLLYTVGDIGQYVQMVIEDERRGEREKASNIVGQLVDEITKHITEKLGKEPQKAMEPLLNLRNLSIAVFGEYDIQYTNFPTISSFSSKLDVIPSKKRPRRIRLNGSNGFVYTYCLKGNEDIRMDERVMQLFGMVNVLLSDAHTPNSAFIHRFPVIPISNNVGLLGWVEHANTINNTICIHRNTISKVRTHQESTVLRTYVDSFGSWDKLSIIQRTEVLEYVMAQPDCDAVDVARAMWHRSNTAEQWLERRTAYTQSLATMSMVGYVLGLGDRHLGNILLSMSTGKIVHIDFGDSFDVGRLRHVLPETVPFRLTRMLTNAMEVFGVNGIFRSSCARTQATLHQHRDSIVALLSAFVYDPIVQHKGKMRNVMEKSRTPQDIVERIRNKLRGTEMAVDDDHITIFNTATESARRPDLLYMSKAFDDAARRTLGKALPPEKQVSMLIEEATGVENYAALYFGWGPLW